MTWGLHVTLASRWLDPAETEALITPFMVLYAIHDALVKPMPAGPNTPSLAESWSVSKDGLTYEFVLRKLATFHNGDPVSADDVKFSFDRYKGAAAKLLKDKVREIQVVDARRVRFHLKEPWPDFMTFYGTSASGAAWIVPRKYVEKVGDDGFKKAPVGAGPYRVVSFTPGVELVMEAFDGYWRKTPSVKRLVFRSIPEEATRAAALKNGEVDIVYLLSGPIAEDVRRTPSLQLVPSQPPAVFWLEFLDQWDPKSPWHDRRVRLAASLAIDRQAVNQAETLGFSRPTGSIIPRAFEYALSFDPPPYDPRRAKQLLVEAGYPNGFDAGDFYPFPPYTSMGEAVAGYLQALGIRTRIQTMERATFLTAWREKKFRGLVMGITGAAGNAATRLEAYVTNGGIYAYGVVPEVEDLFPRQARDAPAPDPEDSSRAGDARPDLRAGVHLGRGAARRGVGRGPDQGARLLGALRRPPLEEAMKGYILRRLGYSFISLFLLSVTIFLFVRVTGDPAVLLVEPGASKDDLEMIRKQFGLDQPLPVQYGSFITSLLRGDFGQSFYYRTPVLELYLSRLPHSLLLAGAAMVFSLVVGIPTGIIAAVRVNRWWDSVGKIFALLGLSMPSFWVGLLMILFFSVYLGWLPSSGSGTLLHLVMPAIALGWVFAAAHMRLTRSSMLEVLGSEYVKLARLKGLPEALVISKHAFKNALIPVLTLAGINLVIMVNVAVVVETVFAWPGVGRLLYEGIAFRDFPVVQATVLLGGAMIVIVNLLVDILYAVIDPRIRY